MPKNKGKGGKNRRRGKNDNDQMKRELVEKDVSQEYAQVLKMLGNGRLTAFCFDGKTRMCHIRGKMRKKIWVNAGDIVLLGLRDYQDDKADVILKYSPDEARCLKANGFLPETTEIHELGEDQMNAEVVQFVNDDDHAFVDELNVGVQSRDYDISSDDSSDEESEKDDTASGEEKENKTSKKVVKQRPAKAFVPSSSSSEESEEESSEEEEEDPELVAERGKFHKPGAREKPKQKGKRGK